MTEELDTEQLTQAMWILDEGLKRIASKHDGAVFLAEEDPEAFGAGHYVLYPEPDTHHARFAIEEQYAPGVGWSDEDRVPTSWLWRAERLIRQPDGTHIWGTERFGEAFPESLPSLLVEVDRWVHRTKNLHDQSQAFRSPGRHGPAPPMLRCSDPPICHGEAVNQLRAHLLSFDDQII